MDRETDRQRDREGGESEARRLSRGRMPAEPPAPAVVATGVCEKNNPFARAFAPQSGSRDCSPAPDLVFFKLVLPRVLQSGGVFFSRTPVSRRALASESRPAQRSRFRASPGPSPGSPNILSFGGCSDLFALRYRITCLHLREDRAKGLRLVGTARPHLSISLSITCAGPAGRKRRLLLAPHRRPPPPPSNVCRKWYVLV